MISFADIIVIKVNHLQTWQRVDGLWNFLEPVVVKRDLFKFGKLRNAWVYTVDLIVVEVQLANRFECADRLRNDFHFVVRQIYFVQRMRLPASQIVKCNVIIKKHKLFEAL